MKAKTFVSCCRLLFIVLCVQLSTCQVVRTPPPFLDTAERSTVRATNQCDDSCNGTFNETLCKMYGACTLQCPSSSRNSFPSYGSSALENICVDNKKQPTNPPGAAATTNGNLFYNNSNGNCVVNKTGNLTRSALSVWVKGSCNNCSFLRIGDPVFLSLSLSDQSDLIINDKIYRNVNGWTHLLIQKAPNTSLSVYINGELKTMLSYGVDPQKIQIGVNTSESSGSVHILDFRLYRDLLTNREVKKLYNNTWDMNYDVPDCRCPVSHPALDSSGYICYGDANSQQPRLEKALRNTSAITDGSSNTSWVSGNTGVTTLTIELGNSFQISSIQLLFLGTLPYNASWMYYFNNSNIDMSQFTCNKTGCQLNG
ncbi:usherin-like [Gigantopelta aegis]|uniref:usherin-like n=1 Tax=Gigantopelta aegis TaxID=1735272 RepID=UPI001B88CD4D|nr:usherin-like [Gigantopelta aegis]